MQDYTSFSANVGDLVFKILPLGIGTDVTKELSQTHVHGTFELHLVFDEKMIFEVDNTTVTLCPDDFLLIFPNVMHRHRPAGKSATRYAFRFSVEKSPKASTTDYYSHLLSCDEKWIMDSNPMISQYIKKILSYVHTEPIFSEDKIRAFFILTFTEVLMPIFKESISFTKLSQETSEYDSIVNKIDRYFNSHYMEDSSLPQLASDLNLSRKQTQYIIKKAFGTTFRECLTNIRLKIARDLLAGTDREIKDIAESVGYQSYNGFYLAFKSKFDITPLEYRETKKQG